MQEYILNGPFFSGIRDMIPSSLRAKLTLGLLPGLIALIVLAGVGFYVVETLVNANQHLADSGWELAQTRTLQFHIQQAIVPLESYVTHNVDNVVRADFEKLVTEVEQLFNEVGAIYGETYEQQLLNQTRLQWYSIRQLGTALLTGAPSTNAENDATLQEVHRAAAEAALTLEDLYTYVETEMGRTMAEGEAARTLAMNLLIGSAIATALAGTSFIFIFSRYIIHPIQILQAAINQVSRGALDRPLHLPQRDELGMLANSFNQMQGNLLYSHKRLAARTVQLEQVSAERERYAHRLRQVLQRTVQIQEDERRRIANDIHDGISQWLLGALFELQAARLQLVETTASSERQLTEQHLLEAQRVLKDAKEEMHRVIHNLHPPLLESHGLLVAIRGYTRELEAHSLLQCELKTEGNPRRLLLQQELAAFRIAQEALHNILKHAGVNRATVVLSFMSDAICLQIRDQGRGFTTSMNAKANTDEVPHLGLLSMQERAQAVGGQCIINANPGQGVCVEVCIPTAGSDDLAQQQRAESDN